MTDAKTNAGSRLSCNKSQVSGLKADMFFDPKSMANIWAFKDVKDQCRIACDSNVDDAFVTHSPNGIKKLEESRDGSCHHKSPKGHEEEVKEQDAKAKKRVSFVETLEENKSRCTAQEID